MKAKSLLILALPLLLISCGNKNVPSTISENSEYISEEPSTSETPILYDGYYDSLVSWTDGEDLKTQLHELISGGNYKALPYTNPNYETNIAADHTEKDFEILNVIYSGENVDSKLTNTGWQREHCWPASLMTGTTTGNASKFLGRATDFHNLWAAKAGANSARSNRNYGIPDKTNEDYTDRMDAENLEGYRCDAQFFEPGDNDKGIVSRSIFYMATMYSEEEKDTVNNVTMKPLNIVEDYVAYTAGNDCEFSIGGLSTLLQWNKFEVSDLEMQHNESVYSHVLSYVNYAQGNRNPYVDYPELVDYVYGDKANEAGKLEDLTPALYTLERSEKAIHNYAILEAKRQYNYTDVYTVSDCKVAKVYNDFSYELADGATCAIEGHMFDSTDGEGRSITVKIDGKSLRYDITLNIAGWCNKQLTITKEGITNTVTTEQSVKFSGTDWGITCWSSANKFSLTNNTKQGGVKFGGGTTPYNGGILKSKDSYKVNGVFIDAYLGNKDSNFLMEIKVGDKTICSDVSIKSNDSQYKAYGEVLSTPLDGIITIKFTGSNSLYLRTIYLNIVE